MRATVVLPVPGLPTKRMWMEGREEEVELFDGVFDQRDDLVDLLGHRFHADELAEFVLGGQIH